MRHLTAATTQLVAGVPAVLLSALVLLGVLDPFSIETARVTLAGTVLVVGVGLLGLWLLARRRRGWLIGLGVVTLLLGLATVALLATLLSRIDPVHDGIWLDAWLGGAAVLLWTAIVLGAGLELRWRPKGSAAQALAPGPRWRPLAAVLGPVAVVLVLGLLLAAALPGWMVGLNGRVTPGGAVGSETPSELDGSVRWQLDLAGDAPVLPTAAGLAVAVDADEEHAGGVVMLDPATGGVRWRAELRGASAAPAELRPTGSGAGIAVAFDGGDLADDVPVRDLTLAVATGEVTALWPAGVVASDPPVRFVKVARGTNSVLALEPSGDVAWRYRPEGCDPRSAASTPEVVLVVRRSCARDQEGSRTLELLGLDSVTGEPRWSTTTGSEQVPEQVLVADGFQLERTGDGLGRRQLDTGELAWSTAARSECGEPLVAATSEAVAVLGCASAADALPAQLRVHDVATGDLLWEREHDRDARALLVLDRDRALTVGPEGDGCTVRLHTADRTTELSSWPERSDPPARGQVRCSGSSLQQIAGTVVVRLGLPGGIGADPQQRLVGLG